MCQFVVNHAKPNVVITEEELDGFMLKQLYTVDSMSKQFEEYKDINFQNLDTYTKILADLLKVTSAEANARSPASSDIGKPWMKSSNVKKIYTITWCLYSGWNIR